MLMVIVKLDVLYEVATKLGLLANIDKSKVLVFRKEGRLVGTCIGSCDRT